MHGHSVGLLGAGRQALETGGYCQEAGFDIAFFVEEQPPEYERERDEYGAPIFNFEDDLEALADVPVIASVGDPTVRRRLVERWPKDQYLTLLSSRAWLAGDCRIGEGCVIAPMAAVNRLCTLGKHVLLNVGAILSHDVVVGDFSTISPGCSVGGRVSIGQGVFLGIGSTIRDRISIGDGAFIAAGTVVVENVEDRQMVMGVPGRPCQSGNESW